MKNNTDIKEPDPVIRKITGCSDCPACDMNDMAPGYSCQLISMFGADTRHIKQEKYQPVTPDWCPIKKQPVLLKY